MGWYLSIFDIEIKGNIYRIGDKLGRIPKNCKHIIIDGFHVINGKVVKNGDVIFIDKKDSNKAEVTITNNIFK